MNIIFCGMPGSGKTTKGKELAKMLGRPFIDTDRLIEKAYHKSASCREIFSWEGEEYFRQLEEEQIASLATCTNAVIALGGGALLSAKTRAVIKSFGQIIYLRCPAEILWSRMDQANLPGYLDTDNPKHSFLEIYAKRTPLYEEVCDLILDHHPTHHPAAAGDPAYRVIL